MAAKSRFVAVRLEPDQVKRLIVLSMHAGDPGNLSEGMRYAINTASAGHQTDRQASASSQGEREVTHA